MTPEITATEGSQPALSDFSRIVGVFFDPRKTFTDVLRSPRWIVPVILLTILSIGLITAFSQHIGWDKIVRQQMDQNSRTQSMTAEQKEQAVAMGVKFGSVIGYVQAVIAPLIMVLIMGAVLMFTANSMLGTKLSYGQMLGITGYASLTGLVTIPLIILVMFLKNPEDFDLRNPLAFNLGAFLSPETAPKWLISLATSIDLFSFWTIALLAIGISCAGRKVTFGKALGSVLIPWAIVVICKAAWTGLFG